MTLEQWLIMLAGVSLPLFYRFFGWWISSCDMSSSRLRWSERKKRKREDDQENIKGRYKTEHKKFQ